MRVTVVGGMKRVSKDKETNWKRALLSSWSAALGLRDCGTDLQGEGRSIYARVYTFL